MTDQSSSILDSNDLLNQALQAAQQGQFAQARTIAETALQGETGDAAPLHGFLGMVCARSGDLPAATDHLVQAHALLPQDITIACNLISLLMDQERDV